MTGKRFGRWGVVEKTDKRGSSGQVYWRCKCDCGTEKLIRSTNLIDQTSQSCGCLRADSKRELVGDKSPSWKGGKYISTSGYVFIKAPQHKNANVNGYVTEHVLVMSKHVGRPMIKNEEVHHRNGIRTDNRLENLELWNKSHPAGSRVEDLVRFAEQVLKQYKPELLK